MASSKGRATAVPIPRSTVRREMAFLVMIMTPISSLIPRGGPSPRSGRSARGDPYAPRRCATHLKRRALHNGQNRRRPAIVRGGRSHDPPDRRRVVIFHLSADRKGEQLARHCPHKLLLLGYKRSSKGRRPFHLGAVEQDAGRVDGRPRIRRAPLPERIE